MKKKPRIKIPQAKGDYFRYIQSIYQDPEFLDKINELREMIVDYENKNPRKVFVGTELSSPKNIKDFIKGLSKEFDITWDRIVLFLDYPEDTPINTNMISTYYDKKLKKIIIEMSPQLTKEDFMGYWAMIEMAKKDISNIKIWQRGSDNPKLAYAVYRAREKDKMKFSVIAQKLSKGELKRYEDRKYISTEEGVKKLYHNFKKGKDKSIA